MKNLDTKMLIAALHDGDDVAKNELIGRFRAYLRLLARLHVQPLLQAKFDESDIVQETCLQALVSLEQFQGDNKRQFAAWLRRILANKGAWMARQYLGTEKRSVQIERRLQQSFDRSSVGIANLIPDRCATPSQNAIQRERSVQLADALARVNPDQREVLIMHGVQARSIAEVAKVMGRSQASTWKIWARGLQALRHAARDELR
jgi:RNA polymerase sigma-70 factor (ECF subfamily)